LVPFSVVDVALITGMPATGKWVEFEEENVTTNFGDLVRERVHEVEQQQLRRRKLRGGTKDNHVYTNFIAAMVYLCERNRGPEQLQLWMRGLC